MNELTKHKLKEGATLAIRYGLVAAVQAAIVGSFILGVA